MFESKLSKMTEVVTGGAGFLGSHLSDRLLAEGFRVVAIDNLITGSPDNVAHLAGNPLIAAFATPADQAIVPATRI